MSNIVPVLMYHHVTPEGGAINVSPDNFRDQLRWLKKNNYHSISSQELADHIKGKPAPKKSILITFDDGYLDNYVYAWPILREFGFKATIFIVTSWIGEGEARNSLNSGDAQLPSTPNHDRCKELMASSDYDKFALRWSEIELMRDSGIIEFHSHTHTHTRWDKQDVDKNSRMQEELQLSRTTLEQRLGSASEHLCWPQGYFDDDYVNIANANGFKYLYTTRAFGRNLPGTDPNYIFRFAVRNTSGASVGRRIVVAASPWMAPVFNSWKKWKRKQRYKG